MTKFLALVGKRIKVGNEEFVVPFEVHDAIVREVDYRHRSRHSRTQAFLVQTLAEHHAALAHVGNWKTCPKERCVAFREYLRDDDEDSLLGALHEFADGGNRTARELRHRGWLEFTVTESGIAALGGKR